MVTNSNNNRLSQKVDQLVLIGVAFLVSIIFTLPRALSVFNVIKSNEGDNLETPLTDVSLRFIVLFLVAWLILQLNANWSALFKNRFLVAEIVITIVVHAILFYGVIQLFLLIYPITNGNNPTSSEVGFLYFGYGIVFVMLFFVARVLRYQVIHKHDLIEKEVLKRHSLENELMALKNQVNPHFLFNSLNSLSALVRENHDATTFINELSYLYRYILQSGGKDLVTIEEELKFLSSYEYLIKTRFGNKIELSVTIEPRWLSFMIPVLSLQLLVENAVKHNEISQENPLQVLIYIDNHHLVVENIIQLRTTLVKSTGQGLHNIRKRYLLLKDQDIIISDSENIFKVKLPLN